MEAWHPVWNNLVYQENGIYNDRKVYRDTAGHWIYYFKSKKNQGQWMVLYIVIVILIISVYQ